MARWVDRILLWVIVKLIAWRGKEFAYRVADEVLIVALEHLKMKKQGVPVGLECAIGFLEELL